MMRLENMGWFKNRDSEGGKINENSKHKGNH